MIFHNLEKEASWNVLGKGENAGNQYFSLFHNVFFPIKDRNHHIYFFVCKCIEFDDIQNFVVWLGVEYSACEEIIVPHDPVGY